MLRGFVEELQISLAENGHVSAETASQLQHVRASTDSLITFVKNILHVAKLEDNEYSLTLSKVDIVAATQSAVNAITTRAAVQGIGIIFSSSQPAIMINADPLSIEEVVINLTDNAIKYSNKGQQVSVAITQPNDQLVNISIIDQGIGIPMSVLPRLFDKFYRSHRSKRKVGGTGIGLYLSKQIVDAHGGRIEVSSTEGKGSNFTISLPIPTDNPDENPSNITRLKNGWIKNHNTVR
jgi:two-component system, OmpR family, phosphate regulon sensor histidine kinase PhoR